MSTQPPQLIRDLEAVRRAGAVIAGVQPTAGDAPKREEEMRAAMTRELDTQLAELSRQMDAHRAVAGHGSNDPHIAALEQRSAHLQALRQTAESASNLVALSQLRGQVTDAVRGAGEVAQAANAALSGGGASGLGGSSSAIAAQRMADATYRAQVAQYSREMAPIMQRVEQHRARDEDLGRRYGVDTKPFGRVDDELKHKAEEARKRGDQPEGIRHDALRGWNSLLRAKTLLDAMPEGADKDKRKAEYDRQLEDQRKAEELRRKSDAAQVESEAKKREGENPFPTPEERKKWVDQEIQKREEQHRQRQDEVARKAGVSPEVRAAVNNDFRRHLGANPTTPTVTPAAASPEAAVQPTSEQPAQPMKMSLAEPDETPAAIPDKAKDAAKKAAEPAAKSGAKPAGEGDKGSSQSPSSSPDKKPEDKQKAK